MNNLCQTVKRQLKGELHLVLNRTMMNGHEHGFPICSDFTPGRIVEGNASTVLIPGCSDGSEQGMIHSHQNSKVMQEHIGRTLMQKYAGYPSAQDIAPHPHVGFGCVASEGMLVCYTKPKKSNGALRHLQEQESVSTEAFRKWQNGGLSDGEFRQVVKRTVKRQEAAMRAASPDGFCSVKL